jgi:hypothetical protein
VTIVVFKELIRSLLSSNILEKEMSLFPEENILTKEIETWKGFANSLKSEEDKEQFLKMLDGCQKYALAINAKGRPFTTEPLIMALLLEQHKMINWLQNKTLSRNKDLTILKKNPDVRKYTPRRKRLIF